MAIVDNPHGGWLLYKHVVGEWVQISVSLRFAVLYVDGRLRFFSAVRKMIFPIARS